MDSFRTGRSESSCVGCKGQISETFLGEGLAEGLPGSGVEETDCSFLRTPRSECPAVRREGYSLHSPRAKAVEALLSVEVPEIDVSAGPISGPGKSLAVRGEGQVVRGVRPPGAARERVDEVLSSVDVP